MALTMTRPTKHPKTGTFIVRLAIPPDVRDTAKRLFGVQAELRENLGTKDPSEARRLAPAAVARLRAKLDQARRTMVEAPAPPTAREVAALAGEFYKRRVGAGGNEAEQDGHWEVAPELFGDDPAVTGPDDPDLPDLEAISRQRAVGLPELNGFATDPDSIARVAAALMRAERAFFRLLKRRAQGDWSPDPNLPTFPTLPRPAPAEPSPAAVTFDSLLSGWARDHGYALDAKPIARAAYDRKQTLARLAQFLGHSDAAKVTKADAVRWKESMQAKELAIATIRNDLSEMSAIWRWAIRNGKLEDNPFAGISPPKERGRKRQRRAFTETEAATILTAAC
jgi:hypothetical protein